MLFYLQRITRIFTDIILDILISGVSRGFTRIIIFMFLYILKIRADTSDTWSNFVSSGSQGYTRIIYFSCTCISLNTWRYE